MFEDPPKVTTTVTYVIGVSRGLYILKYPLSVIVK